MRIVPWHPRYGDAFARLNLEWIERYFRVEEPDRKHLGDPEGTILATGGEIFYAVRGDEVLGTAAAVPCSDDAMELAKMAVAPSAQGQGLGRRLVERVITHARGTGVPHLELITNSGLTTAQRLYESVGFTRLPPPADQAYERGDVYMRLELGREPPHALSFLADTFETERLKTLAAWSLFGEDELGFRAAPLARSPLEQMVHQCASEDAWFRTMLGLETGLPPLPAPESRFGFLLHYARTSAIRLALLRAQAPSWYEVTVPFFDTSRSRAWIITRRIAHTAHHRGQVSVLHRLLRHQLYSTYGPTADTGGLAANQAQVVYRHATVGELLRGATGAALPGPGRNPVTERP